MPNNVIQFPLAKRLAAVARDRGVATASPATARKMPVVEYTKSVGSEYEATKGLDVKDIAKLVRRDIKAAVKRGELPQGLKASVRISRFSMGRSLSICVTKCPVLLANPVWYARGEDDFSGERTLNVGQDASEALEAIGNRYNRTVTDRQTDYCNTNYFLHVSIDGDLLREQAHEAIALF